MIHHNGYHSWALNKNDTVCHVCLCWYIIALACLGLLSATWQYIVKGDAISVMVFSHNDWQELPSVTANQILPLSVTSRLCPCPAIDNEMRSVITAELCSCVNSSSQPRNILIHIVSPWHVCHWWAWPLGHFWSVTQFPILDQFWSPAGPVCPSYDNCPKVMMVSLHY